MSSNSYDAIIIGGGHNGLVCACYLAQAGKKVLILERRSIVGGAAVTEEFHPGFRNSTASYTVSLLNPKIISDLRLYQHGLRIINRPRPNFIPSDDGGYLLSSGTMEVMLEQVAKFSEKDAEALPRYYAMLESVADFLRALLLETPFNPEGGFREALKAIKLWGLMRKIKASTRRDVIDLFTKSAQELLDDYFESETVKALFAFDAVVGNYAAPDTPGSAYVLLHHVFGEVNGEKGAWGHAIGGMGSITQAMLKEAESLGVEVLTDVQVDEVLIENGRAVGVRSAERTWYADVVASNLNPKLLFTKLIDDDELPKSFSDGIRRYRCGSATFRMNVALSELPDFSCLPGTELQPHHQSGIIMAPTQSYMRQAYFDAKQFGWSRMPIVEMLIPSTVDDSLAPEGAHVASLFCQHFDSELPAGLNWDDCREEAAEAIIRTVDHFAPNFSRAIIAKQLHSPLDLERKFGLVAGDIMHGSLGLDQLYMNRPVYGFGDYRTPIKGLYTCGSGAHPGGGVTGVPGHNAAREILKDS